MKKLLRTILLFTVFLSTGNANATFFYYSGSGTTNSSNALSAWESKVSSTTISGQSLSIDLFDTTYAHVNGATGLGFGSTDNNVNLSVISDTTLQNSDTSGTATFTGANSGIAGFDWDFKLTSFETTNSGATHSGVFFNDDPTGKTPAQQDAFNEVLSIGKFNGFTSGDTHEYQNDNFTLEITNSAGLYAFAFNMVNNKDYGGTGSSSDEWLEVFADKAASGTSFENSGDTTLAFFGDSDGVNPTNNAIPGYSGTYEDNFDHVSFVGIVTDDLNQAFKWLEFNEDNNPNDIGIYNLRFAGVNAVPVPAAVWLFGSGLMALFGLGRRRSS